MNKKNAIRYKLKSFDYSASRFLFTILELGQSGELRKYAEDIMSSRSWQDDFSVSDIRKIACAAQLESSLQPKC